MTDQCPKCSVELTDENWYASLRKRRERICKPCAIQRTRKWQDDNQERHQANQRRHYLENRDDRIEKAKAYQKRKYYERRLAVLNSRMAVSGE